MSDCSGVIFHYWCLDGEETTKVTIDSIDVEEVLKLDPNDDFFSLVSDFGYTLNIFSLFTLITGIVYLVWGEFEEKK